MVDKYSTVPINRQFIQSRIEELALKKYWLSEQIGVDKGTFSRWLNGRIKRVRKDHVKQLAQLLDCTPDDLIDRESDTYSTLLDQHQAAALIDSKDLFSSLASSANFELITGIVKSSLNPYLPKKLTGKLFNILGMSVWYLNKSKLSNHYLSKAQKIGEELGDLKIQSRANLTLGALAYNYGDLAKGKTLVEKSLEQPEALEMRDQGVAKILLGYELFLAGDFKNSQIAFRKIYQDICQWPDFPMKSIVLNLAATYLAEVSLNIADLATAEQAINDMELSSRQANYLFGRNILPVVSAWYFALNDCQEKSYQQLKQVNSSFLWPRLYQLKLTAIAGRTYRILGNLEMANETIEKGLVLIDGSLPLYEAELLHERWLLERQSNTLSASKTFLQIKKVYQQCQVANRLEQLSHVDKTQ